MHGFAAEVGGAIPLPTVTGRGTQPPLQPGSLIPIGRVCNIPVIALLSTRSCPTFSRGLPTTKAPLCCPTLSLGFDVPPTSTCGKVTDRRGIRVRHPRVVHFVPPLTCTPHPQAPYVQPVVREGAAGALGCPLHVPQPLTAARTCRTEPMARWITPADRVALCGDVAAARYPAWPGRHLRRGRGPAPERRSPKGRLPEAPGQHLSGLMRESRLAGSCRARSPSGATHPAFSTRTTQLAHTGAVYGGVGVTGLQPPGQCWTYG
jgi:hypothetical protein